MTPEDRPVAADAYDAMADTFAEEVRENPYNAHLEFPATTSLVPDVAGRRVLDAGCGTGVYAAWLREAGAEVVGLDVSREMLAHARRAVDDRAGFVRGDLGSPLGLATDGFDAVVSPLALGYVEDLADPFGEFARVLRPGGVLVFSTGHPHDQFPPEGEAATATYFDVERITKEWDVEVPAFRRPLQAIVNPLVDAGFRIERLLEPQPTEAFAEAWPERYEKESRYPVFLCVRATLPEDA